LLLANIVFVGCCLLQLLCYMPTAVAPSLKIRRSKKWRQVQLDVKQQVVAMVRDALAQASDGGFECDLHGRKAKLFPILAAVVLDHKEMQDFAQASNPRFSARYHLRRGG
jgi:hypothetical protein